MQIYPNISLYRTFLFFALLNFLRRSHGFNMAAAKSAVHLSSLFLGTCLPSLKHNAAKFKVQYLYFDQYLKKPLYLFAYDPQKICKSGDIALIKELPPKASRSINHEVLEVVYPCGDVTDPVTGKKVVASMFRDEIEAKNSLYGKVQSSFNYKIAPRRGWQEGKRDFSHRESYLKYHEFDEGDENKNQPHSTAF